EKAKVAAKNIEGKITEAVGKVTGDLDTQLEGQTKQAEAEIRQVAEDRKDEEKNENIDVVSDD
ncbi:MAG TPA: CsbD family protein, partial [Coleofasciculaceae cyanobacterium]